MVDRKGNEGTLQSSVVAALGIYRFLSGGTTFTPKTLDTPTSAQQGTNLETGDGKPYDVAFQLNDDCKVFFLEVKHRHDKNRFTSTRTGDPQHRVLMELWNQGIQVWYTYNHVPLSELPSLPHDLLTATHVMKPFDFTAPLEENLAPPQGKAKTLLALLGEAIEDPVGLRLGSLLKSDDAVFEFISTSTLLFIANIHDHSFTLVDAAPVLKSAREYRVLPQDKRDDTLAKLKKNSPEYAVAKFMFELADSTAAQAALRAQQQPALDSAAATLPTKHGQDGPTSISTSHKKPGR